MSRWRQVVRRELAQYRADTGFEVVDLDEVYEQLLPVVASEFPDNDHPSAKLRQVLQQLRDRDEVEFLAPGTYRLVGIGADERSGETGSPSRGDAPETAYHAAEYETTATARSMSAAFRRAVLGRYGETCPVSGVDHRQLVDVAHILPWAEYDDLRTDPRNVLLLGKTHHAAFDAGLFTLDSDLRIRVAPSFETESDLLGRTLVSREGERVRLPADAPDVRDCLERHNRRLDWAVAN